MANLFSEILFLIQRFNWLSLLDIALVSAIFYFILLALRNTQAQTLLRGVVILAILIVLLTSLVNLPAFFLVDPQYPAGAALRHPGDLHARAAARAGAAGRAGHRSCCCMSAIKPTWKSCKR